MTIVFSPIYKLYKDNNFRNTDEEFPLRQRFPTNYNKNVEIAPGVFVFAPLYICDTEMGAPSICSSENEENVHFLNFYIDGYDKEHQIDVYYRDIGLEDFSSILGCKVCSAIGYSKELGLINIYSRIPIPLPPKDISCVEEKIFTDNVCSICCESGNNIIKTKCGHFFHKTCLRRWSMISRTCPNCRQSF